MLTRTMLLLLLNVAYVCWAYDPRRVDVPFISNKHKRYFSSFNSDELAVRVQARSNFSSPAQARKREFRPRPGTGPTQTVNVWTRPGPARKFQAHTRSIPAGQRRYDYEDNDILSLVILLLLLLIIIILMFTLITASHADNHSMFTNEEKEEQEDDEADEDDVVVFIIVIIIILGLCLRAVCTAGCIRGTVGGGMRLVVLGVREEIMSYLRLYQQEMMIWRCRDAIQPYWDGHVIPVVELYCEVIGVLQSVQWLHRGEVLVTGDDKYTQRVIPHYANGRYFNCWLDFTLRVHNATRSDSGVYYFRACAVDGDTERQQIHVDIS
ncbi:hypothetical protein LSAT2_014650 [Lamellibrachia satsuma]|nr:hypothetical protein LSAT2_014650 [Lamellibrachia satsuma]